MTDLFLKHFNLTSVINFIVIALMLYFAIRHIIPYFFSKNVEDNHKNFDALVRQKKQELTSTTLESVTVDSMLTDAILLKSQSEFLKFIESKFRNHLDFYKKLEADTSWQENVIVQDFKKNYPDSLLFDLQFHDLKKVLLNSNYDLVHRGDYVKVLIITWLEKFYYCLSHNYPLPALNHGLHLSDDLSVHRWSFLRITLDEYSWQESLFDNQSIFAASKNKIFTSKSLMYLTQNYKAWWSRYLNLLYQLEAFLPINDIDVENVLKNDLSKKDKINLLKKYHPDSMSWDIIDPKYRSSYEKILNENFSKINNILAD